MGSIMRHAMSIPDHHPAIQGASASTPEVLVGPDARTARLLAGGRSSLPSLIQVGTVSFQEEDVPFRRRGYVPGCTYPERLTWIRA